MNYISVYNSKKKTLAEILSFVCSDSTIAAGTAAMAPHEFLSNIHTISPAISNVQILSCLLVEKYEFYTNPEYKDRFFSNSLFYTSWKRDFHTQGNISFLPAHLHLAGSKYLSLHF